LLTLGYIGCPYRYFGFSFRPSNAGNISIKDHTVKPIRRGITI
jgi:hypothetical protein